MATENEPGDDKALEPGTDTVPSIAGDVEKTPPAIEPFDAEVPVKKGPGRPRLSDAEKAERAKAREEAKAVNAAVPLEIAKKYEVKPKPGKAPAKAPPTPEQIAKVTKALEKTFSFLGEMVYEVFSDPEKGLVIEFKEQKAKDLADAWADILAEYMGENAGDIVKWTTAICCTGYVVTKSVKEIREAKATHEKKLKGKVS